MGTRETRRDRVARWLATRLPARLRAHGVLEAHLFGSWARDEADAESDIDLIVVAPSTRPFVERFRDYMDIVTSAPAGMDLLIYSPEEFRKHRRRRFLRHALRDAKRIA